MVRGYLKVLELESGRATRALPTAAAALASATGFNPSTETRLAFSGQLAAVLRQLADIKKAPD
jgi:hypothetical protein